MAAALDVGTGRRSERQSNRGSVAIRMEVSAHITGIVWKIEVKEGDRVAEGQACVILESMKMEMPVEATVAGVVETIHVAEGQSVAEGQALLTLVTA